MRLNLNLDSDSNLDLEAGESDLEGPSVALSAHWEAPSGRMIN